MNKTLGIIGGGQLGMMICESAIKLGYQVIVLDPNPNCSCRILAQEIIVSDFNNYDQLEELCKKCDAITYEFENIPWQFIEKLSKKYLIMQGSNPLYYSQHRIREKESAKNAGLVCPRFSPIYSKEDLNLAIQNLGLPIVLKTCMFGYDGKGQIVLRDLNHLQEAYKLIEVGECIAEEFVPFDFEVSAIGVRNLKNHFDILPISKNVHIHNILHKSIVPAGIDEELTQKIQQSVKQLMTYLNLYGILAIEFFVKGKELYFNEMAPRPHNSGHYSIEGCNVSQFEQLVNIVMKDELEKSVLLHPTIMVNVLGQHVKGIESLPKDPNTFVHMYHKLDAKHNRKMGHVTFIKKTEAEVDELIEKYWG